jgi:hypothetical protein
VQPTHTHHHIHALAGGWAHIYLAYNMSMHCAQYQQKVPWLRYDVRAIKINLGAAACARHGGKRAVFIYTHYAPIHFWIGPTNTWPCTLSMAVSVLA